MGNVDAQKTKRALYTEKPKYLVKNSNGSAYFAGKILKKIENLRLCSLLPFQLELPKISAPFNKFRSCQSPERDRGVVKARLHLDYSNRFVFVQMVNSLTILLT